MEDDSGSKIKAEIIPATEKVDRRRSMPHLFKPGQSGNPSGRAKDVYNLRELARSHTKLAVDTLVELAKDGPAAVRVAAAAHLLDRGYGKPQQSIQVDVEDNREEILRVQMIELRSKDPVLAAAMLKLGEAIVEQESEVERDE